MLKTMTNTNNLPFALSADALESWLDSLSALPQLHAAHQLNQVLKQLKNEQDSAELLPLLLCLTPLTLHYANNITALTCERETADKSRKAAKLSMQLLRQLSLLFSGLAETPSLTEAERLSAAYYALQCIGYCMRCYCLFYETPSATLWKKSASLYSLAAEQNALLIEHAAQITEFKLHPTIESVVKRNLLFSLLIPTLFTPKEINQIFQIATQLADLLDISQTPNSLDFGFYWDLNDELPPCPTRKSKRALPQGFLAIDTQAIGQTLQQDLQIANLNRSFQTKLAVHLLDYQPVFDSIIPGQTLRSEFLFGFNNVAAFLHELNKLQRIKQLSGQNKSASTAKRNLALIPLEHEKNAFETMTQALDKAHSISKSGNVLKISHTAYLVAEGHTFDCSSGDLAMFYRDQEPATLAIIRQQSALSLSNVTHILMEKLPGFYSVYTFKTASGNRTAIVIDENNDNRQVFLPPDKYNVDSKIPLTIDKFLHLTACLESNSFFARFRFNFDS